MVVLLSRRSVVSAAVREGAAHAGLAVCEAGQAGVPGAGWVQLPTAIYTHVLNRGPAGVRSPADRMFAP